ncbi:syntaxin-61-like isoform X3 [Musa acuminata AAA Group]|uniref:syntaxin-61-like isoform X3 n=1 Tax=Musa acuminata AAA Group TaxID=214697 RepID=UPI0031D2D7FF
MDLGLRRRSISLEECAEMTPAQDPFYVVKEEIQESVDELDMAIAVAVRDPAWYGLDEVELEKHRRWTSTAHYQVGNIRKTVETGKEKQNSFSLGTNGVRKELLGLPNDHASQAGRSTNYINQDNDDFISSESDQQLLLIKKEDEELDELSASVWRIGDVGLTIHDELVGQGKLLDEFGMEMESTSNRLDFVQKKVAKVMKKAGAKGQIMMIAFLIVLFIILFFFGFLHIDGD